MDLQIENRSREMRGKLGGLSGASRESRGQSKSEFVSFALHTKHSGYLVRTWCRNILSMRLQVVVRLWQKYLADNYNLYHWEME